MFREGRGGDADARDEVLGRLVEQGVVSAGQAAAVGEALERAGIGTGGRAAVRWTEIAGYAGGGLVLAGVFALLATAWQDLGDTVRVLLLAAIALVAAVAGVAMAGGPRAVLGPDSLAGRIRPALAGPAVPVVRRRVAGVLFALAAVATVFAVNVGLGESEASWWVALLGGFAVAAAGYAALRSAVGLVVCWWMSGGLALAVFDAVAPTRVGYEVYQGLILFALGLVWGGLAVGGAFVERRLGLGLGAGMALLGAQLLVAWDAAPVAGYLLTLATAAILLGYYRWERAAVLLVFGVLGVTVGVTELVWDITDGAIGAAAILLTAGAVLLASCWAGIRLHAGGAAPTGRPGAGPGDGAPEPDAPEPAPGTDRAE
ncbi:hypothetical protein HNR23_001257 [Nocardiopsis mwathae]|uniref:DUF2157 domain-containing protein n=1 Tax=Nocardiopsis mwathae TaxID=1472723 RepID=A0A7X0D4E4_9ACTN|nr:hypothetical protein [Nocardiopsis mwathae]MBB6171197.1 hypothetical protein [Nocardiopsis mwathae]